MRRYRTWAGNPLGSPEDTNRCIVLVIDKGKRTISYQCYRKRGKGLDGLYCSHHAKMLKEGAHLSIPKEVNNVLERKMKNMKGEWYWDETTGSIVRLELREYIYHLQDRVETLEEAQEIIANLNKKKKGGTMSSKKGRKAAAAKKAAQVIEKTAEEVEEEVEEEEVEEEEVEEEEEEPKPKKAKKTKKAEKTAPEAKTKKAKKPAAKLTADDNPVGPKELAGMVDMDPKALRKVLREEFPDHEPKSQWLWKRGSKELDKLVKKLNK